MIPTIPMTRMFPMFRRALGRKLALGAALLVLAPLAVAHNFWIQPSAFHTAPDTVLKVHLMVGSQFPGDPVARDPQRIVRFDAYGPAGEQPIAGRDGMDPAGLVRFKTSGLYTLAYQSTPAPVAMEAAKFEAYLKDEGLEKVIEARAATGRSATEAREHYSRCCKSLVRVGDAPADGFDRTIGLPLELTALDDPFTAGPGGTLRFRLDDRGKPREGLLVKAHNTDHPNEVISARTGADGTVSFTLPYHGMWVVTAVQMDEAPKGSGAEWESLWASLSFEIVEPPAPEATR